MRPAPQPPLRHTPMSHIESSLSAGVLPDGVEFAFSTLDDTDDSTVENTAPIYALLAELGMRTTKTVWPLDCPEGSENFFAGHTLERADYRDWVLDLRRRGFEVTWHCATMESSTRERTLRGLEAFREHFGEYPTIHVNHANNLENVYWGPLRYRNPLLRLAHRALVRHSIEYLGQEEGSPYFWGDVLKDRFAFTRAFAFAEINTLRVDAGLVYQLRATPWVNAWFSTSDAPDAAAFKRLVTRRSIDRLRAERGICILSTHLGKRFVSDGIVDPEIEDTLRYLAEQPGWFVPVSTILAAAVRAHGGSVPVRGIMDQARMEVRHAVDRIRS